MESIPVLKLAKIQQAPTIYLKFEGGAYAHMIFSPGENDYWKVTLQTDWGNWSYGWNQENIFKFVLRMGTAYAYDKFTNDVQIYDHEATIADMKRQLEEECGKIWNVESVQEEDENDYWDEYKELKSQVEHIETARPQTIDEFIAMVSAAPAIVDVYCEYFRHMGVTKPHPRNVYFFDHIYPLFREHLEQLSEQQEKINDENLRCNNENNAKSNSETGSTETQVGTEA